MVNQISKTISPLTHNQYFYYILLILAIIGVLLLRYITPFGLGLVNDSVGYIAGARNLIAGHGYSRVTGNGSFVPITNYPPMFSLLMAAVGITGLEIVRAARLVVLLCFAVNIIMCGELSRRLTASNAFGILGAVLFLISEPFLQIHAYALSEPLYLSLSMLTLLSLQKYATIKQTPGSHLAYLFLALSGVLACLSFLTRYPGVALYITALLVVFLFNQSWRKRSLDSLIFFTASLPGVIIWSLRNAIVSGNPANRALTYHLIPVDKVTEGLNNFWSWFLPDDIVNISDTSSNIIAWQMITLLLMAGLLILIVKILTILKQKSAILANIWSGILIFSLHTLIYIAVIVFTLTFLDASPIFEHRILSPAYISLLLLIPVSLAWLWNKNVWTKVLSAVISLTLITTFALDSLPSVQNLHEYGQGYISLRWQRSSVIEVVKELPPIILFSNKTQAVYLLAERPAYVLVSPFNPATQTERSDYDATLDVIRQMVYDGEAMLVIFDYQELISNPENAWMSNLTRDLPLYGEYWDGTIFGTILQ